jgi:hypothetical protein
MEQLLPSASSNVSDGSLCQSVLEVGIDPTIGESLLPLRAVVNEGVVGEASVVCMVVFNIYEMVCRELFESEFGLDGFIA